MSRNTSKAGILEPYYFIAPALGVLIVLVMYPLMYTVYLSLSAGSAFTFANFLFVLSDPYSWNSLIQTGVYALFTVLVTFPLGLLSAVALNEKFRFRTGLRLGILLPWVIPYVSGAIIWRFLLLFPFGHFDYLLRYLGILTGDYGMLTSSPEAMVSVILVTVWRFYPFVMTMLLAGIQGISGELYDAAKVDGAGAFRRFVHVTIPELMPTMMVVLLIVVTWSMNAFSIIYLMTGGGPGLSTQIYSLYIYRTVFYQYQFQRGAAASILLFLIGVVFSLLYVQWVRKHD